jgi:hypothetical protein
MDWQLGVVGIIIAVSAGYLLRASWRTFLGAKSNCGGNCGCGGKLKASVNNGPVTLVPLNQNRLRNSKPPQ